LPLDALAALPENAAVHLPNQLRTVLIAVAAAAFATPLACAVTPYTQATVTRYQNNVTYGDSAGRARRPAKTGDIVAAEKYLLTETDSRAELKYEDGSIVRVGQNTVFTFEANTRTLELEKGSLLFYIPKGSGGGTIRTASITAAITGTVGKVTENIIAILEGEVTLVPSGRKVPAGFFARANADGSITIARFDIDKALGGVLMDFGGPIGTFDETKLRVLGQPRPPGSPLPDFSTFDTLDRTQNHPGAQQLYFPPEVIRPNNRPNVPPPTNRPGRPDGNY
jgi:ferric-dicitrate binding protein FerR (iron transport regulator)